MRKVRKSAISQSAHTSGVRVIANAVAAMFAVAVILNVFGYSADARSRLGVPDGTPTYVEDGMLCYDKYSCCGREEDKSKCVQIPICVTQ